MSILQKAMDLAVDVGDSEADNEKKEKNELSRPPADAANANRATPAHDVPRGCFGPSACSVLGICGRISCLVDETDRIEFGEAAVAARRLNTPHRVPDRFVGNESDG